MNNALTTKQTPLADYLNSPEAKSKLDVVLGERRSQFVTSVVSLANAVPALQECDRKSLLAACMTAASLDLPVNQNLGFAYIIPYKNNKTHETLAQFQMGYKGFIQLAMRSGQFKTINATDVRQGEITERDRLTGEISFSWAEDNREKLPTIGYVAYMRLINGFEKSLYMTTKELEAHGIRFSQSARKGYGLWKDDFDAMAKKTVIKLLISKWAPLSTQLQTATLADQSVAREDGQFEYVDNQPVDPTDIASEKEKSRVLKHIATAKTVEELDKVRDHLADDEMSQAYEDRLQILLQDESN